MRTARMDGRRALPARATEVTERTRDAPAKWRSRRREKLGADSLPMTRPPPNGEEVRPGVRCLHAGKGNAHRLAERSRRLFQTTRQGILKHRENTHPGLHRGT